MSKQMTVMAGKLNIVPAVFDDRPTSEIVYSLVRAIVEDTGTTIDLRRGHTWKFGLRETAEPKGLGLCLMGQIGRIGSKILVRDSDQGFVSQKESGIVTPIHFLLHAKSELMVVEQRRDLRFEQFARAFEELCKKLGQPIVSSVSVNPIIRRESFAEYLESSGSIYSVNATLVPPNPGDGPDLLPLADWLVVDQQADQTQVRWESEKGLNKKSRVFAHFPGLMERGYVRSLTAQGVDAEGNRRRYDGKSRENVLRGKLQNAGGSIHDLRYAFVEQLRSWLHQRRDDT